jgi:hypothetical protein
MAADEGGSAWAAWAANSWLCQRRYERQSDAVAKKECELKHVLVGVDGSDAAAAALGWAGRLAGLVDADVVVATAFRPDQAEVSPEYYEELKREAEHRLADAWSEPLHDSGVQHRAVLVGGALARTELPALDRCFDSAER